MSLFITHKETKFGVGDRVRVLVKTEEAGKTRSAIFEGIVISIKQGENPSFIVRRIGEQQVGIERIFPINMPSLEKVDIIKKGTAGVKHAKLFYLRGKSPHEVEKIYSRTSKKGVSLVKANRKRISKKTIKNGKNKT